MTEDPVIKSIIQEVDILDHRNVDFGGRLSLNLEISEVFTGLRLNEPTALLVDVNNWYKQCEKLGFRLDYIKLKNILNHRCDLRYARLFKAFDPEDTRNKAFERQMEDAGYTIFAKPIHRYTDRVKDITVTKGNVDIKMAIAAVKLPPIFTHVIIGTCDGEFGDLVDELKEDGSRRVSVMGMRSKNGTGVSESLVKKADNFYDLSRIRDFLSYKDGRNAENIIREPRI